MEVHPNTVQQLSKSLARLSGATRGLRARMTADPITPEVKCEGTETKKKICDPDDAHRARASTAMPESITFRGAYSHFTPSTPLYEPPF